MAMINSNIHAPAGALATLQAIDLERISTLGLGTKIVMYMSRGNLSDNTTITYIGPIYVFDSNLALPQAVYSNGPPTDFEKKIQKERLTPDYALLGKPNKLEFILTAMMDSEYHGLEMFRDSLLPRLLRDGYNHCDYSRVSEFWMYAGQKEPKKETVLLNMSPGGLTIANTEAYGIKVFTSKDVNRLLTLEINK